MSALLPIVIGNAMAVAILAIIVSGIARIVKSPSFVHALWTLVLIKMITPPIWQAPVYLPEVLTRHAASQASNAPTAKSTKPSLQLEFDLSKVEAPKAMQSDSSRTSGESILNSPQDARIHSGNDRVAASVSTTGALIEKRNKLQRFVSASGMAGLWLLVALAWLLLAAARIVRFNRMLHSAGSYSETLNNKSVQVARKFGDQRTPRVLLVNKRISPFLWPFGIRSTIVLPESLIADLNPDELDTMLAHELAHYFRRDHWVRWVVVMIRGLFWWHPAIWWACRRLRQAEEECCDAKVLRAFPNHSKSYANALLKTLDFLAGNPKSIPAMACGFGRTSKLKHIKRRFEMILQENNGFGMKPIHQLTLAIIGIVALPLSAAVVPDAEAFPTQESAISKTIQSQTHDSIHGRTPNYAGAPNQNTSSTPKPKMSAESFPDDESPDASNLEQRLSKLEAFMNQTRELETLKMEIGHLENQLKLANQGYQIEREKILADQESSAKKIDLLTKLQDADSETKEALQHQERIHGAHLLRLKQTEAEEGTERAKLSVALEKKRNELKKRLSMADPLSTENQYKVQRGDTLDNIARQYGLSLAELLKMNPDINVNGLRVGQKIFVPTTSQMQRRRPGQLGQHPGSPSGIPDSRASNLIGEWSAESGMESTLLWFAENGQCYFNRLDPSKESIAPTFNGQWKGINNDLVAWWTREGEKIARIMDLTDDRLVLRVDREILEFQKLN